MHSIGRIRIIFAAGLTFAAGVTAATLGTAAQAAEIKVIDSNALTLAMKEIAAGFTKETGHTVTFNGLSPGRLADRIKAGDVYDLVITATADAAAFEKEGRFRPGTRHPLARVGIGVAIRQGSKIDLSTVESTRQALLNAKSITFGDSSSGGLSGINAQKVLVNLGIAEAVKDKAKATPNGQELVGRGEVEIGLYNVSEIPRAKDVVLAGPVPAAVQVYINYDSAVPVTNNSPELALSLVKYLTRPASRPIWTKAGLEIAPE